jgi:prepilin-type N-terminal cleavage/methylation domain-containing protein
MNPRSAPTRSGVISRSTSRRPTARAAFTLIEMMVVIGIVLVLAGILLPVTFRARKAADRARTALDLQTIGAALEAFKGDTRDYPRAGTFPARKPRPGAALGGPTDLVTYGPEVLALCLIGDPGYQVKGPKGGLVAFDNQDGPGFRARPSSNKLGPYLEAGRFNVARVGDPDAGNGVFELQDRNGSPILYVPKREAALQSALATAKYVLDNNPNLAGQPDPLYNHWYAVGPNGPIITLEQMQLMMGDTNRNGVIDSPRETPATNAPYVLWAAGPDRRFGPTDLTPSAVGACDDVTNFAR